MQQLSGHQAGFLYTDTTHSNSNVSLLHIYDQSTAPGGKVRFKSILAHIASRLDRSPLFRQRLQRVPLELDNPYWVADGNFDLEYHVRHLALPKPGDWRQFCIQVSRIHARALDLDRPLWEVYVIEGLDSLLELPEGSFALMVKTHLAAVDVDQAGELTRLLHDTSATPPPPPPPAPWFPDSPPGWMALATRGALVSLASPLRMAAPLGRAMAQAAPAMLSLLGERLMHPETAPVTRFNSVVSPHRVFDTRRFMLTEFDAIRALVPGATLNDAVLAVCGGALRRYLDAQGELPEASLAALAPRAMPMPAPRAMPTPARNKDRTETPAAATRDVSFLHVQLGTDTADPVPRLAAIHRQTRSADTVARAVGARALDELGAQAPAPTLALTRKLIGEAALQLGRRSPLAHCSITYLASPAEPQYLCGARMTYDSAILPIADGMGLVFAVTGYDGRIVISPTSCRELMPDPEAFAQALRDSFQEYLALARQPRKRRATHAVGAADITKTARSTQRTPPRRQAASNALKQARPAGRSSPGKPSPRSRPG